MTSWPLIFIAAVSTIFLVSCSNDLERLPVKSLVLPEFFMFRPKNFVCTDENCFEEKIQKTQKLITQQNDEPPNISQDYDWANTNITEIENELMKKRGGSSDEYEQRACSCQTRYHMLNLGQNHYPDKFMVGVCENQDGNNPCCSGYSCKEIRYKVTVLTLRSENDVQEKPKLPKDLKEKWILKPMNISVACHCTLNGSK